MSIYLKYLYNLIRHIIAFLTVVMSLVVFLQVILRYTMQHPFGWTEELARVTFLVWVLLGATLAYERNMHLGLDFLEVTLPRKIQAITILIRRMLVILFAAIMLKQGITLTGTLIATTPILGLPFSKIYLILPVMMALILFMALIQLAGDIGLLRSIFHKGNGQD